MRPFLGRVGLTELFEAIESDSFYIGPWHHENGDLRVYSWAAPIASVYFGTDGYPTLNGKLQITRAFAHATDRIVDFDEDRHDGMDGPSAFDRKAPLLIPRPPSKRPSAAVPTSRLPSQAATAAPQEPPLTATESPSTESPRGGIAAPDQTTSPLRGTSDPTPSQQNQKAPALRHSGALRKALSAPRQAALSHVLSTLQPEQYRLVTWPADEPLAIYHDGKNHHEAIAW